MSKNLSAKYYQENKKNYKNHNFSKEENKKATVWSWTLQNSLKSKSLLSIENKYNRMRKNAFL